MSTIAQRTQCPVSISHWDTERRRERERGESGQMVWLIRDSRERRWRKRL